MTETRSGTTILGGWITNEISWFSLPLSLSVCLYLCQEIQWHSVFSALERISFLDDIVIINRAHERGTWNGKACDRNDDSVCNFLEEGLASRHVNLIAEKSKRFVRPNQNNLLLLQLFFDAFLWEICSSPMMIISSPSPMEINGGNTRTKERRRNYERKKIEFNLLKLKSIDRSKVKLIQIDIGEGYRRTVGF